MSYQRLTLFGRILNDRSVRKAVVEALIGFRLLSAIAVVHAKCSEGHLRAQCSLFIPPSCDVASKKLAKKLPRLQAQVLCPI